MKYSVRLKILGSLTLVIAAAVWAGPRVLATLNPPVPVHLTPLAGPFKNPIGIDFQDTSGGNLIATINYPTGGSAGDGSFARINPVTGTFTAFAPSVFGLFEEIKVAVVHLSSNIDGFVDGDVYSGNGIPGQIMKISADGLTVTNPWVSLPGETAHLRGSLFQDRYGAFGGDLIVVTGNEQEEADPAANGVGKVWRISSAGLPTLVRDFQKHLEGVTTIPNDPARYGPIAGRILAGDEDRFFVGGVQRSSANGDGAGCRVLAVAPDGTYITLTPAPTDLNGPIPNYHLPVALCPEDFDVITSGAPFFGVNYGDGRVLTAPASDFAAFCGDVLVSQEFPSGFANVSAPGVSGLNVLHWNPTTLEFDVTPLSTDLAITQWEHVTFAGGSDCATPRQPSLLLSKTPDGGTFTQGGQTTFTFFVTNNASGPTAGPAINVQLADNLPGNGGLVWVTATPTQGTCVSPIVGNQLHCSLGDIQPGGVVTVTVQSAASTPAAACQLQDNPLALATADNSPGAIDGGSLTCTPPPPPPPPLVSGDTATIGFWHNQNGQAVINCLNGGPTSTALGNYLATTYPSLFGAGPGSLGNLAGKTNEQIAAIYLGGTYFGASGQKVNAQIIAVALATYVTKSSLGGTCGAQFGFNSSAGGTGDKTYNVGLNGHLLGPGFVDNQSYTISQLLLGANAAKAAGTFNANAWNAVFDGINNLGDI